MIARRSQVDRDRAQLLETLNRPRDAAVADLRHRREEDLRQRAEQEGAALRVLRETPVTLPEPLREALDRIQRRAREQSANSDGGATE